MKKKLPKTMYVVHLNHTCKVHRDFHDPLHWRPAGSIKNGGKYINWLPAYIVGGIRSPSGPAIHFFKTKIQAELFRTGALIFKYYLANKLTGHDGGI